MSGRRGDPIDKVDERSPAEDQKQPGWNNKMTAVNRVLGSAVTPLHLVSLALTIVLAAGGLVSLADVAYAVFCYFYVCIYLSRVVYPVTNVARKGSPAERNRIFWSYIILTAIVGLLAPIFYILDGLLRGDEFGARAASPHLFLLAAQTFMEGIGFSDGHSLPIGIFVAIFFNARRIFTLVEWVRSEFAEEHVRVSAGRMYAGRALASVNMALWCFNLFGLLLPVFLPRVLNIYYTGSK